MIPIQITLEEKTFTIYIISGYPTRSKYVIRALKSALNQDYSNYNIVLRLGYEIPELEDLIDEKVTISYFDHERNFMKNERMPPGTTQEAINNGRTG